MNKSNHYISFILLLLISISVAAQNKSRKQLESDRKRIKKEIKMVNKLLFDAKQHLLNSSIP